MDPNQVFIVSALSRKGIAEELNEYLDNCGLDTVFTEDDDRLTDEICTTLAKKQGEMDMCEAAVSEQGRAEHWSDALCEALLSLGFSIA